MFEIFENVFPLEEDFPTSAIDGQRLSSYEAIYADWGDSEDCRNLFKVQEIQVCFQPNLSCVCHILLLSKSDDRLLGHAHFSFDHKRWEEIRSN